MNAVLENSFRYSDQPRWFDFYNCRVVLPERSLYFFTMPFVLSGPELPPDQVGLYVYDGGNGGADGRSQVAMETIGPTGWSASATGCDMTWQKNGSKHNRFQETAIQVTGPSSVWDIEIESFLADQPEPIADARVFALAERMMLRQAPFIHRVPRMKGFARGVIEQEGCRYSFDRGIVYQAKNHGHKFPEKWTWLHANVFEEDPNVAFEIAVLNDHGTETAMMRVSRPDSVRILGTWAGDDIQLERDGGEYRFTGRSADGSLSVSGHASHRENVVFTFRSPDESLFENDESLLGTLSVTIEGQALTTQFAALGHAHRVTPPA